VLFTRRVRVASAARAAASRPRRARARRLAAVGAALAAGAAAASCATTDTHRASTPGRQAATTTSTLVPATGVPLGVYGGPGDPGSVAKFARLTGTRPSLGSDYLPSSKGWSGMTEAGPLAEFIAPWQGRGYRLVLGVPMMPSDHGSTQGSLAGGAAGAHDAQFRTLAETLVSYGEGDAIVRPGWEFNANWYPWAVSDPTSAAHYAAYFRRIVTAMRSVPGAAFTFVWNLTPGSSPVDLSLAYPGDAYVDYIGLDVYDQVWDVAQDPTDAWNSYLTEDYGLRWLSSFAAQHHRPLAIPEWGLAVRSDGHGLGDDPAFVAHMSDWLVAHHAAFSSYFDLNAPDGEHDITDGHFRHSLAMFKRAFSTTREAVLPASS